MTGRKLYDAYTDARRGNRTERKYQGGQWKSTVVDTDRLLAWPYLPERERRVWDETAKAITSRNGNVRR